MLHAEAEKKMLFILNPKAGTMQANKHILDIVETFEDGGYLFTIKLTKKSGDARDFAEQYAKEVDLIVCAGGDGTLNEVVEGVLSAESDCPIGYIPAGSTNDFGNSLGLPKDIKTAAESIVRGTPETIDVGSFNHRYFSYVASFGAFTSTSYTVPQNLKNIMGHTAYVLQGIRDVISIKPIHARVVVEPGTPQEYAVEGDYIFGAICNSTSIGGIIKLDAFGVNMNDGLMEALLIRSPSNIIELNAIARTLLSGSLESPNITFFSGKRFRIEIQGGTHWTLDGEYEEGADVIEIDTLDSAVRLMMEKKDTELLG